MVSFITNGRILNSYYRFFGISTLNNNAKHFCLTAHLVSGFYDFLGSLTNTFFVLYALDILKGDYFAFATLLTAQYIVQMCIDYPTGVLGDWIGQRWVMIISSLFYAIGFLALSSALTGQMLLIAYIFLAFGNAFNSGAFQAWFDNNYKCYAPEDNEKRVYIEFNGKFGMTMTYITAISFILGGILIMLSSRSVIFFMQSMLFALGIILLYICLKDHPAIQRPKKPTFSQYLGILGNGLLFVARNRTLRWLFLGTVLTATVYEVWGNMLLFPMYQSYGKTDDWTAVLRAAIFIINATLFGYLAIYAKRIKNTQKWLALSTLIFNGAFFFLFYCFFTIIPPSLTFNPLKYLLVIGMFVLVFLPSNISGLLMPRFYLEIVPDKYRNSIYSLTPTLILIGNIFAINFGGYLVKTHGMPNVLPYLGIWCLIGAIITAYAIYTHLSKPAEIVQLQPSTVIPTVPDSAEKTPIDISS